MPDAQPKIHVGFATGSSPSPGAAYQPNRESGEKDQSGSWPQVLEQFEQPK